MGTLSSLIAVLCCIVPALIVILGIGGVTTALTITLYKNYFLVMSFVFLAVAIGMYFRKNKSCCTMRNRVKFIIATLITYLAFYTLITFLIVPRITAIKFEGEIAPGDREHYQRIIVLSVDGMTCPSCATILEDRLKKEEGIIKAEVSYYDGKGEVTYDPDRIAKEEIISLFKPYRAEVVEDKSVN